MIRAYRLYTGPDGNSHVVRGSISENKLVDAQSILFKETPPQSSFDWHNDPIPQYVITLAGVLEFATVGGETFTIHPGEVLLAVDHTGSGHGHYQEGCSAYARLWRHQLAVGVIGVQAGDKDRRTQKVTGPGRRHRDRSVERTAAQQTDERYRT